jgi:hypothetical protein
MCNIEICTQKSLPVEMEPVARRLAMEINPANASKVGAVTLGKRWAPGSTITVAFIDGTPDQKSRVQPYFHQWTKYANLKFIFILNKFNADVRVSFREGEGSWSLVGVDCLLGPKDEPSTVFGWISPQTAEKEVRRVVLHEVGHVLGFEHELESPGEGGPRYDEPKILAYYAQPPHNWSPEETRRQVLDKLSPTGLRFTPFDKKSIMCYFVPDDFTVDKSGTPWNDNLSATDKKLAAEVYP